MRASHLKFPAGVVLAVALAGGAAADNPVQKDGQKKDGERPPAAKGESLTLTGKLSKEDTKRKKDDGSEVTVTTFVLTEDGGNKVQLPSPRGTEGGKAPNPNLADFVGKTVTVTGQGVTAPVKEGSTTKRVVRLTTVTEVKEKK
jgi:hypothetical protein